MQRHEPDFGNLLSAYLTSASSHQIAFTCIVIEDWAASNSSASLSQTSPLIARLSPLILTALESDAATIYSETSEYLSQIHTLCFQVLSIYKNKGQVPAERIPDISVSNQDFTLDRASSVVGGKEFDALNTLLTEKGRAAAQSLLDELRQRIQIQIARTEALKEAQDVQVYSAIAGAVVAIRVLPAKMNPLIRSAMNGLKFEVNEDLQARAARTIAILIDLCSSPDRVAKSNPADKIIANVCAFLCQDTTVTPVFAHCKDANKDVFSSAGDVTATTPARDSIKAMSKKEMAYIQTEAAEGEAIVKARLVRKGAILALKELSEVFHDGLFVRLPKLWACSSETLLEVLSADAQDADSKCAASDATGQKLLDCLTVLSSITPVLPALLQPAVAQLLPKLVIAIQSGFAVVRHVTARCLAVLCDTIPQEGMHSVVTDILPFTADPLSVSRRRGAVELISCKEGFRKIYTEELTDVWHDRSSQRNGRQDPALLDIPRRTSPWQNDRFGRWGTRAGDQHICYAN